MLENIGDSGMQKSHWAKNLGNSLEIWIVGPKRSPPQTTSKLRVLLRNAYFSKGKMGGPKKKSTPNNFKTFFLGENGRPNRTKPLLPDSWGGFTEMPVFTMKSGLHKEPESSLSPKMPIKLGGGNGKAGFC